MKKRVILALMLLMAVGMQAQTYWNGTSNKVFSGSGTQNDPYLISTPEQLAGLAERVNNKESFEEKFIKLMSDLYMSDPNAAKEDKHEWVPIGKMTITQDPLDQWSMTFDTCYFRGTFDGNGHTIHHLYMGTVGEVSFGSLDDPTQEDVLDFSGTDYSFFGYIDGGSVRNLTISDLGLAATGHMGGLAAVVRNGKIENVHVKDSRIMQSNVLAYACGGLIGSISNTIVENSSVENTVILAASANGFVGKMGNNAIVCHCHASGYVYVTLSDVSATVNSLGRASGFCSNLDAGCLIEDCYATVQVNVSGGPISTIYNAGWVAGFVHANDGGIIRNCYSTGDCAGAKAAGFCVRNTGLIESCYATGNIFSGEMDTPATFIYENGYEYFVQYVGTVGLYPGIIRNCFSTGTCYEGEKPLTRGFLTSSVGTYSNAVYSDGSQNISCWFNNDNAPAAPEWNSIGTEGTIGATTAFMQSQAFVDTLNIVAALFGLNKWQYNAGAYPTLTNEKATDISAIFEGGNGSKENPWLIANLQHLKNLRALVNLGMDFRGLYVKQTADIALNAPQDQWAQQMPEQWTPIADTRTEAKFNCTHQYTFRGTYDGGFHEVKNMYISNMKDGQAFFGQVGNGAVVKNLGVTDGYIKQDGSVGSAALLIGGFPRYDSDITIAQCWTSGSVDYIFAPVNYFSAGALVAGLPLEGTVRMLNCSSTASLKAHETTWAAAPDMYHVGIGQNDTVGNFLYTGGPVTLVPNEGYAYNFNAFYDCDVYPTHKTEREAYSNYGRSTATLQSAEFVNILNDYVDAWNAKNEFQLDYWKPEEGQYPQVTPNFQPPHTVTYDSKGGSVVAARHVLDKSYILPPDKPTKEGFIFAGWYSDAACTQFFDYDTTPISGNITLYAKWLTPTYDTYDLTPFDNTFATEYHIANKAQLIGFVKAVNGIAGVRSANSFEGKTIYLDADILLNDTADWHHWGRYAYAESWEPIGRESAKFMGRFEGQGHIISGLYYDSKDYALPAFFGYVYRANKEDIVIRQLGIQASVVKANNSGALFVGCLREGTIEQCFASGKVIDYYQGSDGYGVGGFAANVGGYWAGEHGGQVKDCYSRADVYTNYVKGDERSDLNLAWQSFVSGSSEASFVNCYAAGQAYSAGFPNSTTYTVDCFYDKELLSASAVQGGKAKSTNEMHAIYSFTNWDFENIWGRNESINAGYPYLRCFVSNPPANDPDAPIVKDITLEETTLSLIAGASVQLHASVVPETAVNKKIHWSIDKTNFATVNEKGFVQTIADNNKHNTEAVIITATTDEGEYTKKCTLNIQYPSLTVSPLTAKRRIGETTWQSASSSVTPTVGFEYIIYAYSTPSEAHTPVSWSADETLVAIIPETDDATYSGSAASKAILRLLKAGTASIKATDERGLTATRTLILKVVEVTSIKLPYSSKSMYVGETFELVPTITPAETTEIPQLTWTSSNPEVAGVDENGVVSALQAGTAVVTVACGTVTASITITVSPVQPSSIKLNETSIELTVGQTFQLIASISPENATDKTVTWTSSAPEYASVDENGLVIAIKARYREVTITAKTSNGKKATCKVKVGDVEEPQDPIYYTIRFLNWDGDVLQRSDVEEYDMPVYTGQTPTRLEDDKYTYVFSGWSPEIEEATEDADYTAQFEATEKPVAPEPEAITVRLASSTTTGWSKVYLYSWTGSGGTQPTGAWPGTAVSKDAEGWWAYTFAKSIQNINIIWNNGTGAQTVDITGITSSTCYTLNGTTGTKITVTVVGCNTATATEEINSDSNAEPRKILINGKLYIITPDGTIYDAQGVKVK